MKEKGLWEKGSGAIKIWGRENDSMIVETGTIKHGLGLKGINMPTDEYRRAEVKGLDKDCPYYDQQVIANLLKDVIDRWARSETTLGKIRNELLKLLYWIEIEGDIKCHEGLCDDFDETRKVIRLLSAVNREKK